VRDALKMAGYAGAVLFVFGLLSFALSGGFDLWTAVHVAAGGALVLAAVAANLAGVRSTVVRRGTRERLQALTGTAVFAAILVGANVLAARYPKTWDATEEKIHTLGEKTLAVLRGATAPVELVAFFPSADRARPALEELLKRVAAASPKVSYRFVDPEVDPQLATQFGISRQGTLAARCGTATAQTSGGATGAIEEGDLTSLLLKVTRPGGRRIDVLTGHGEPAIDDAVEPTGWAAAAQALGEDNLETRPLLLATAAAVPEDAAAVVLAGPKKPLLPHEVEALRAYLARGGRLAVFLDPGEGAELAPLLADYRLTADDTMIVDQQEIPFLGARLGLDPIIEEFPPHPITRSFRERIVLSQARSITIGVDGGIAGVTTEPLARTRPESWAETAWRDALKTGRVARDDADSPGPRLVAATAKAKIAAEEGKEARLVVFGDSDWTANGNLGAFFNRELFVDVMRWLLGSEDLIVGPPKQMRASRLNMTVADQRNLFRFGVLLLPEVLLIGGLLAWRRRKSL
jgi:gliding motility-associatede transport system auxiliary component